MDALRRPLIVLTGWPRRLPGLGPVFDELPATLL
jgi:hypothetical protein